MTYQLQSATIRTNNTEAGIQKIAELWADVTAGKLPILFDSAHVLAEGTSPVVKYSRYVNQISGESGDYDLSIIAADGEFFAQMEAAASAGKYKKYEHSSAKQEDCIGAAWGEVWQAQKDGTIDRSYTEDYEVTIPAAYSADGKWHCNLYIAVKR